MTRMASSEAACHSPPPILTSVLIARSHDVIKTSCLSFSLFYQYSPLSSSNLSLLFLLAPTVVYFPVSLPLLPLLLCFPALHTCSGTQPCASQPGQGGEQTAPVFPDNHHITCMPAPLLSLCSVSSALCPACQLTSAKPTTAPTPQLSPLHLPCHTSAI